MPLKKTYKNGQSVNVWLSAIGWVIVKIVSFDGQYYKCSTKDGTIYYVQASEIL